MIQGKNQGRKDDLELGPVAGWWLRSDRWWSNDSAGIRGGIMTQNWD